MEFNTIELSSLLLLLLLSVFLLLLLLLYLNKYQILCHSYAHWILIVKIDLGFLLIDMTMAAMGS